MVPNLQVRRLIIAARLKITLVKHCRANKCDTDNRNHNRRHKPGRHGGYSWTSRQMFGTGLPEVNLAHQLSERLQLLAIFFARSAGTWMSAIAVVTIASRFSRLS